MATMEQQQSKATLLAETVLRRSKVVLSSSVLIFSTILIAAGIVGGHNNLGVANSWGAAALLLLSFLMLGISEGFQVGCMTIEACTKEELADANPRVRAIHDMVYPQGKSKMDKLFIGQSFLVVFFSFIIANLTTYSSTAIPALDQVAKTGVQGVVFTVCMCQLFPSVLAKKRPFFFLSIPGVGAVIKIALLIAELGVLESLFLVVAFWDRFAFGGADAAQQVEEKSLLDQEEAAGSVNPMLSIDGVDSKPTAAAPTSANNNTSLNLKKRIAKVLKYVMSSLLTLSALVFVLFSIIGGYSSFPAPVFVQLALFLSALVFIFYAEGVKVAVISDSGGSLSGGSVLTLLQSAGEESVERFMIGRQQLVVPLGFLIAQICSFGASDLRYIFNAGWRFVLLAVGLPTVITVLIFAQLAPQLLANKHRQKFLALPGAYLLVLLCLAIEKLGLVQVTFFLIETIFGVQQ